MTQMFHFVVLLSLALLACNVLAANTNRQDNRGRYISNQNDPYYNGRYYKNRDYYNNRQYYDNNYFRRYNPEVAAPQARILEQELESNNNGNYAYRFETENGIHAEERGVAVKAGTEEQKEVVEGSYSFISPEGLRVIVRYIADENGFHPTITYDGVSSDQLIAAQQPADVVINRNNS